MTAIVGARSWPAARQRGLWQDKQFITARDWLFGTMGMIACCAGTAAAVATEAEDAGSGQTSAYVVPSENSADSDVLTVPFLPASGNEFGRDGFVRVINHDGSGGEVRIDAFDDEGAAYGPVTLSVSAKASVNFNTRDLEAGNPAKGMAGSTGLGQGDWRLHFASTLDIEALAYVRTPDGLLTAMHDVLPVVEGRHWAQIFNPGDNTDQASVLRVVNPNAEAATVLVEGVDDRGHSPGPGVTMSIPPGASRSFTAEELESGSAPGLAGSLGDGAGKWRLTLRSESRVSAMGLLSNPTGHLTNLSTGPRHENVNVHEVPLFPAASDPMGRQGFVRLINPGEAEATVRIDAFDDTDRAYETLSLAVAANRVVHFNSGDLELGNVAKGLAGSTGAGEGDWRLAISSDADVEVLSYVRMPDGFLTAMHDLAPSSGTRYRVPTFNPGSNTERQSLLRVVNPGSRDSVVTVKGVDDAGKSSVGSVVMRVPPGAARTLSASQLESGGDGFDGALGDGAGKWQLTVTSDHPVAVMSLLSGATGHLTNLSTAPGRGAGPPESAQEAFMAQVSVVVQAKCVACHVEGGEAQHTRLVFVDETVEGHMAENQRAFERFLSATDDGATAVLDKIRGVDHDGGVQVPEETAEYAAVKRYLDLLVAEARDRVPTDGELVVGGSATGEIEEPGDEDWFAVELSVGVSYRVDLEGQSTDAGTLSDPFIAGVHGPSGYHGGTVDGNSGEGRNAAVALTPTETGTYYIAATGSGASTGTYRLSVAEYSDDHPDNWSTTGTVAVDGLAHGEIEEPGDEDWFAVELSAGVSYRVDLEGQSTDAGTLSDPFIAGVHGPSGYHGGTVDGNSGEGRNAAVALTPTEQGTYYIAATGSGASTGTYRLSVTEYEDDRPDQPEK